MKIFTKQSLETLQVEIEKLRESYDKETTSPCPSCENGKLLFVETRCLPYVCSLCQYTGDEIDVLMVEKGIKFDEAAESLAKKVGVELQLANKQPKSCGCKTTGNGTSIFERAAVDILNLKDPEVKNYLMKKVLEEAREQT